ncbi:hypothetical protein E2C01_038316 [Portunus trituberculatus]|uniref:Uncharacterized protein n=1 Tax=Portunus trituberculatus TaxID=210409 RepID=A0A5B7FHA2_PORTR|nr:hypothetical protein [Portunus trituberculatus]
MDDQGKVIALGDFNAHVATPQFKDNNGNYYQYHGIGPRSTLCHRVHGCKTGYVFRRITAQGIGTGETAVYAQKIKSKIQETPPPILTEMNEACDVEAAVTEGCRIIRAAAATAAVPSSRVTNPTTTSYYQQCLGLAGAKVEKIIRNQ